MPAFTRPYRLILSFWRGEAEIVRRLAKDGTDAVLLAAALLTEVGELEHGDRLTVTEAVDAGDTPEVSRSSHYS
jgi:hypothetical protein